MCHCVVTLVCGVVSFTRLPEISTRIARGKLIEFLPPPGFTLGLGGRPVCSESPIRSRGRLPVGLGPLNEIRCHSVWPRAQFDVALWTWAVSRGFSHGFLWEAKVMLAHTLQPPALSNLDNIIFMLLQ